MLHPIVARVLEIWPIVRLSPYVRNSRTHSQDQINRIAASIEKFGFTIPVLADENGQIIAGHGRVLAALVLNMSEVPVIIARGWSEAEKRAYVIADNQLALDAGWDEDLLREELLALRDLEFDLSLTGFHDDELARLLDAIPEGHTDPDVEVQPPKNPTAKRGDLFHLGRHRILCGDATDAADVATLLNGTIPSLMVTDPPYGVDYDPDWRNRVHRADGSLVGGLAVGLVKNDDRADWQQAYDLFPGDVAYVWHGAMHTAEFQQSLQQSQFDMRCQIIWSKSNFAIGRGHYHWQHEACWYAVRKGRPSHWNGDRTQTSVWQIAKPQASETGHSTQKPVACMRRPIENNSRPGEQIYDPFVGSGTTLIAAEMAGRTALTMEIDPGYVDVAIERWQAFAGQTAKRSDGTTFEQLKQQRAGELLCAG